MVSIGKPGYGKTILSSVIIEDLRSRLRYRPLGRYSAQIVAFYHFEHRKPQASRPISAFQAILTQIIHACRKDRDLIDIVSLVKHDTGSGQLRAAQQDLLMILKTLVRRVYVYLVFDGLDECTDWQEFLRGLEVFTDGMNCKIILLGRPHARWLRPQVRYMALQSNSNTTDLEAFLQPKLEQLLSSGAVAGNLSLDEVLHALVSQANGMFLWATLMANYLFLPFLSPWERRYAIDNIKLFDSLDAMFRMILEERKKNLPNDQWEKLRRMFMCLTDGFGWWTTETLNMALAIQFNRAFNQTDLIDNFDVSIVKLSSSLVEVHSDNTVAFIHMSVAEFFGAASQTQDGFYFERYDAHCTLALLCMSYLIFNVPHGPLSGNCNTAADTRSLTMQFPMLRYAALNWPIHLSECLKSMMQPNGPPVLSSDMDICLSALSMILSNKAPHLLTTWIEASWCYQVAPDLMILWGQIKRFLHSVTYSKTPFLSFGSESISAILDQTAELSVDLASINHQWGLVLRSEPNEIWLPSIKSFSKSKFWSGTEAQTVQSLTANDEQGSILISSQVSSDGSKVGVLRVWPPV